MSTYKTNKGAIIDLNIIRDQNKNVIAAGNVRMNANGDELGQDGAIIRTARKASQNTHKIAKEVRSVGLKGDTNEELPTKVTKSKKEEKPIKSKEKSSKEQEVELEDGSIIIQDDAKNED